MARAHPVTAYARRIVAGKEPAGRDRVNACRRHLLDLRRPDLRWDWQEASDAIAFLRDLHIVDASGALRPMGEPPGWHQFVMGSLFGWKFRASGLYRFLKAYIETGRASGKTPLGAAAMLWKFLRAHRSEPRIYITAGTGEKQAGTAFDDLVRFIVNDEALDALMRVQTARIRLLGAGRSEIAVFASSSGRAVGASGFRPLAVMVDEYHTAKGTEMMTEFESTMVKRENRLMVVTTNAGRDRGIPCWGERMDAVAAAGGDPAHDRLFAFVCGVDDGDDLGAEQTWAKANPGMVDRVPPVEVIREEHDRMARRASEFSEFRRLWCGEWVGSRSPLVEVRDLERALLDWPLKPEQGAWPDQEELAAMDCVMGVDLGAIHDLTAVATLWFDRHDETRQYAEVVCFAARATFRQKEAVDGTDYSGFAAEPGREWLVATKGRSTDFDQVADWIAERIREHGVLGLAVDPWKWDKVEAGMRKRGVKVPRRGGLAAGPVLIARHPQGYAPYGGHRDLGRKGEPKLHMTESIEELRRGVEEGWLRLRFNPLLSGAVAGSCVVDDGKDNLAFTKIGVKVRDDPAVALTMAAGLAEQYRRAAAGQGMTVFTVEPGAEASWLEDGEVKRVQ